jgi:hypothetical protein
LEMMPTPKSLWRTVKFMLYDHLLTGLQKPKAQKVDLAKGLPFATASESPRDF